MSRRVPRSWPASLRRALVGLFATDRVVQVSTGILVAVFVVHAVGVTRLTQPLFTHPLFGVLTVWAVRRNLRSIRGGSERGFWRDIEAATLAGLVPSVTMPLWEILGWPALWVVGLLGLVASYAFLLLAIERRPHQATWWRSSEFERQLSLPAVLLFVIGLVIYISVIPIWWSGQLAAGLPQTLLLVPILTLLVSVRFGWQVGTSADDPRWRSIYLVYFVALSILLVFHAARIGVFGLEPVEEPRLALWIVPPWLLILATRLRHAPFPRPQPQDEVFLSLRAPEVTTRTMLLALGPSLFHFLGARSGLFDPDLQAPRELWVLAWSLGLGSVAAVQSRLLAHRLNEMVHERRRIEQVLAHNEHRLRVSDTRRDVSRALEETRDRLRKAFRSSPYAMTISTLEDGRHLEVNDRYLRAIGWSRDEVIGHTSSELGIWDDPSARRDIVRRLTSGQSVRDVVIEFRDRQGRLHRAMGSSALLTIDGRQCVLGVIRPMPDDDASAALARRADVLARIPGPVAVTDAAGDIVWWSRGPLATLPEEARGQALAERFDGADPPSGGSGAAIRDGAIRREPDEEPLPATLWIATLESEREEPGGSLVIAVPRTPFTGL